MIEHKFDVKTKIISTLGPASDSKEKIKQLILAGVDVFRLNTSHGDIENHKKVFKRIRSISKSLDEKISIIIDLQGPKIRVGILKKPILLKDGDIIILKPGMEQNDESIPIDYPNITKNIKKGDILLFDDGKIQIKAISVDSKITAKVTHGGLLKQRKGLNIPGASLSVSAITERDKKFIKFAAEQKADYIALSFVRTKNDVLTAKKYIDEFNEKIPVIAKIEKPQAVENIEEIIQVCDGVMVARGDLGIEISPENVPIIQKKIIKKANDHKKTVIVATQMLESMIEQPIPTRAEASDVANAILDGTDAVMLSGETAMGEFPVETVEMMNNIAKTVENSKLLKVNQHKRKSKDIKEVDSQAISSAVISILDEANIKAIIAFTQTGFTANLLSKEKPNVPIISISNNNQVCQQLNLLWGVFPYSLKYGSNLTLSSLDKVDNMLINKTFLKKGDKIIITGSIPCLTTGKTNFIRIHKIKDVNV